MADHPAIKNLTVQEVKAGMDAGKILLVDVREPDELAAESIPGAVDMPLKSFDASKLPDPGDKQLVFSCRSGNRSVTASLMAQAAGLPYNAHMAGGIKVKAENMRAAALQGFATATDLADYLVKRGLPFRDAHEVVAHAVRDCEQRGIDLADLTLAELQAYNPAIEADVHQVLTLEGSVAARKHIGGTAPERVREEAQRVLNETA